MKLGRVHRRCSLCGGRMTRAQVGGRFDGRFDTRTGKPIYRWYWACRDWSFGSSVNAFAYHDHKPIKTNAVRRRLEVRP